MLFLSSLRAMFRKVVILASRRSSDRPLASECLKGWTHRWAVSCAGDVTIRCQFGCHSPVFGNLSLIYFFIIATISLKNNSVFFALSYQTEIVYGKKKSEDI